MKTRIKLNTQVVVVAILLLAVTLGIMAYFSHRTLRQEAVRNAEQMLEGTLQDIDNVLLSVEQSTGNIYYDLVQHLDNPDRMYVYSRELVESNPNIAGCAIVFKPGYYPGKDLFMAYVHRKGSAADGSSELVTSETFTNRPYTEQVWYAEPMKTGRIGWTDPLKGNDTEGDPLVTFCLPFNDKDNERVGVIAVDVSISRLSKIILDAKPSRNGYIVLLGHNGSYIVHPDKEKLLNPAVFSQLERNVDASELEAAKVMLAGESGMREFRRDGHDWYVFYKPFTRVEWEGRTNEKNGWSVGVVCPEEDIFGMHNILLYLVLALAVAGILLFFLLSSWVIRRQLRSVKYLVRSAHHIADGNYSEELPSTDRQDEIGQLQKRFRRMQQSLQNQVNEQQEQMSQLQRQGDMLQSAYDMTVETEQMKTSFLLYMTGQLGASAEVIDNSVTNLCNNYDDIGKRETNRLVSTIQRKTQAIVEILNHMAYFTGHELGKEAAHD